MASSISALGETNSAWWTQVNKVNNPHPLSPESGNLGQRMLDSRSSACRIPDNNKAQDSLKVSNPPFYIVLFQALGEAVR